MAFSSFYCKTYNTHTSELEVTWGQMSWREGKVLYMHVHHSTLGHFISHNDHIVVII